MPKYDLILLVSFLICLAGCSPNKIHGIEGDNNRNNQVVISEKGSIVVNPQSKSIAETGILPEDILTKLNPSTSISYAKQLLGEPKHQVTMQESKMKLYIWHFKNAFLSIYQSLDDQSIQTITLIKASMKQPDKFIIYPSEYILGNLKRSDLKESCGVLQNQVLSVRSQVSFFKCYFGASLNYYDFEFGNFDGGNVTYEYGDEDNTRFNYVSISSDREKVNIEETFYWTYYLAR